MTFRLPPALTVGCPICHRPPGAICCDPRGDGLWGRPHRLRVRRAQLARAADPAQWGPIEPAALLRQLAAEHQRDRDAANRWGRHWDAAPLIAWQVFNAQRERGRPINPRALPWHARRAVDRVQQATHWPA